VTRRLLCWLALAATLVGCLPGRRVAPVLPLPGPPPSPEALLRKLDERSAALRSFRALAELDYAGPRGSAHIREVVLVERPDHLRIEMMSAFGVVLQVTSDGQQIYAYHRGEKTFYRGKASVENLARFTRLDLDLREIVDLLVGLPPGRHRLRELTISPDEASRSWRVSGLLPDGGTFLVWFGADDLLPARAALFDREGEQVYAAVYSGYIEVGGIAIPQQIEFEAPAEQAKVKLRYSNVSVNEPLAKNLFRFDPPPGSKRVDLDRAAEVEPGLE
jgi:outer membrane lipoprotein-sorting protein